MSEAALWSALGVWSLKELYRIIQDRSLKQEKNSADHSVRLAVLGEQLETLRDRVRDLEKSEKALWRTVESDGGHDA